MGELYSGGLKAYIQEFWNVLDLGNLWIITILIIQYINFYFYTATAFNPLSRYDVYDNLNAKANMLKLKSSVTSMSGSSSITGMSGAINTTNSPHTIWEHAKYPGFENAVDLFADAQSIAAYFVTYRQLSVLSSI